MTEEKLSSGDESHRIRKAEDDLRNEQPKAKRNKSEEFSPSNVPQKSTLFTKLAFNGSQFKMPIRVNEERCEIVVLGKHKYQKSATEQISNIYSQLFEKRRLKL
uniref:Uncharacterized protein n=1 Tax=Parastrongyloides trichosuri TaxID=131310 RepID=A0A0N4ZMK7_PARTI